MIKTVWRATGALLLVTAILLGGVIAHPASAQQIALTFDDLPAHSNLPPGETRMDVAQKIITALKAAKVPPVYGFVNAVRIQEQPDTIHVLEAWRAAGFPLGNHTWSHLNLDEHTLAEYEADFQRNEPVLQQQMGNGDFRWFRYPFLAEGKTPEKRDGFRAFLAANHYRIAGVTMSFGDYAFNEPYARCSAKGDTGGIARLEIEYLDGAAKSLDYSRAAARALYGHDIPYVLLMHIGAFDARMLPRLLALYHDHGVQFVSLEQAEQDPFYASDLQPASQQPDTLEAALAAKHLSAPPSPSLPAELNNMCR